MKKLLNKFSDFVKPVIIAALFILLCIPCFGMTGSIFKPIFISFGVAFLICCVVSFFRQSEIMVAYALMIFVLFWLCFAVANEIYLQIKAGFVFKWLEFFYFDKLLVVGTVWLACTIFFCFKRLLDKSNIDDYNVFFKYNAVSFVIFYSFLLIYSFVLIRLETGDYPLRLQPFLTIKEYIEQFHTIPYEVLMMVLGNLFYFTPLGFILIILLKKNSTGLNVAVNILFPVVTFGLLEFSQFVFQNGYCEFDDIIMNSIGFWLGNILCIMLDKITVCITHGRIKAFWG